ncbi:MAG: HD domain-containing protein [Acidimicrobiia bacterium]|nr:HD domain-containing protein [Acidimicrobiia bacterium]MDH5236838.1 HD domain-containing protein [Acidimicrobiia bacterium]
MGGAWHLTRRFFGSLRPGGPRPSDQEWVDGVLSAEERALWGRLYGPDRRHSVAVTRRVEAALGSDATTPVLAAALLHDVGKVQSGLRTYTRVAATLSAAVAGRETAELWVRGSGLTRRIGLYLQHPQIGADLLAMAGSDELVVAWAREHHLPREQWTLDPAVAEVLYLADDD